MSNKGLYIVFEGPDGSGKSMQAQKVVQKLNAMGRRTVHFREPGGEIGRDNNVGEKIRQILQDKGNIINAKCELALFTANRTQLIEEIKVYIDKGINVICERSFLSSIVYQGFGRGLPIDTIIEVTKIFIDKLPDIVFVYNVDIEKSLARVHGRGEKDRIENEPDEFHCRIVEGYKSLKSVCDKLSVPCVKMDTGEMRWDEYEDRVVNEILSI